MTKFQAATLAGAFLAGVGIIFFFFGGRPVTVGVSYRSAFSVFCHFWTLGFGFSFVEEVRKRLAPSYKNLEWLGVLVGGLLLFFVGATLCRLACLILEGQPLMHDRVTYALLFFVVAVGTGMASAKLAGMIWNRKR